MNIDINDSLITQHATELDFLCLELMTAHSDSSKISELSTFIHTQFDSIAKAVNNSYFSFAIVLANAGLFCDAAQLLINISTSQLRQSSRILLKEVLLNIISRYDETPANKLHPLLAAVGKLSTRTDLNVEEYEILTKFAALIGYQSGSKLLRLRTLLLQKRINLNFGATEELELSTLIDNAKTFDSIRNLRPNIIFYTLHWGGTGAIAPIIYEYMQSYHDYECMIGPSEIADAWYPTLVETKRALILMNHYSCDVMQPFLMREDHRALCLIRDPRDAVISEVKYSSMNLVNNGLPAFTPEQERTTILENIKTCWPERLKNAEKWRNLPDNVCFKFSFEELKCNIPEMTRRILAFLDVEIEEDALRSLCDRWSFEKKAGFAEGTRKEGKKDDRSGIMFRRGLPGAWKETFDQEIADTFERYCGEYLKLWGYSW